MRVLRGLGRCVLGIIASVVIVAAASAQTPPPPSLEIGEAPAISPADAWSYFSPLVGTSPARPADPLVERTATALGDDPTRIYAFVYNEIEVVPLFGVQKGARGCLIDKACTPFDQVHLLAELLRAADAHNSGISLNTVYKFGEVTLTLTQMTDWFGVANQTALNEVLADSGIPFTSSGTNYTLLHMWVEVTIGGATYRLDPSFKSHIVRTGIVNLDTIMGFNASTFMSSALSGSSSSTSGAPQVAAFNRGNVRSNLQTYSVNLLNEIRANHADDEIEDIVGGRDIIPFQGSLPTTPGYTLGTVRATFNNDVPLALRTQTTIEVLANGVQATFQWTLDQYYGEELALIPMQQFPSPEGGPQEPVTFRVHRNGAPITGDLIGAEAGIRVTFNHPYAANGGGYFDRAIGGGGSFHGGAVQIIVGGGRMREGFGAYIEARSPAEESYVEYRTANPEDLDRRINSQRATKRRYAASFAVQFEAATDMAGRIGHGSVVLHDAVIIAWTLPMLDINRANSSVGAISVVGGISANAHSGSTADTLGLRRTVVALAATLEGSAVEQNLDAVYPFSTAARFDWFSGSSEHLAPDRRFYWANASNWAWVSTQILNDNYYDNSESRPIAERYIQAGYTVIIPRSSDLGPGEEEPVPLIPGPERGIALVAISPSGIAHVVTAQNVELKGGGGTNDAEVNATRVFSIPDAFLDEQYASRAGAHSVDLSNGVVTYTPPPDLVVGEGAYPYSLSFQRSYRSGLPYDGAQRVDDPRRIRSWEEIFENTGWTSNFMAEARMRNDGQRAFGRQSPREATDTIAAVRVLLALSGDQGSDLQTLQYQLGGLHTLAWWSEQLTYNSVQLVHGSDQRSFFRLADNTFQGQPGDIAQVELSGAREIRRPLLSVASRWSYNGMCAEVSERDGSVSYYGPWISDFTACDTSAGGPIPSASTRWMRFRRQSFREGVVVDFTEDYNAGTMTLSNNLGRSITLTTSLDDQPTLAYALRDDSAPTTRTVALNLDLTSGPGTLSVTGTDGNAWVYNGSTDENWRVFAPSSTTQAIATFDYLWASCPTPPAFCPADTRVRGQVEHLIDAVGNEADYFISTGRIGAIIDPLGGVTRTYFDDYGQPIRVTNRLGHDTFTEYDNFRRVESVTHPESNREIYTYDARHNRTGVRRVAKGQTPGGPTDIVTSATYDTLCNMPLTQTDGNGNTTSYTLLANRCLISRMTQPGVDNGMNGSTALEAPQTDYTWNAFGQLVTRTDPTGRVVTNSYVPPPNSGYPANYLYSVTVADGGSGIITRFGRSAAGDITSVTDPRSNVHTGTYDASRRLTRYDGPSGTGAASEWRYNVDGLVDRVRQATGLVSPNDWATTTYAYLATGRPERMTDPDGGITQYSYDALNRPDCVAVRMNTAVYGSLPTSACALSTEGSAGPDRISRTEYDAEGQVLRERRAYGTSLAQIYAERTWTANGQLDTVDDANNNRSNLDYDDFDRLRRLYFPDGTLGSETASTTDFEEYGYDDNDNRISLRLRSSETIGYSYDALNREIFKDIPGGTSADVTSRYDLAGRRTFARFSTTLTPSPDCSATGNPGIDYCYDAVGRLQFETSYGRRLQFAYDPASNRERITHPDSTYFRYTYDALDRVDQVQLNGSASGLSLIADYAYDPQSRRTSITRGNSAATTYGYTAASRLTSLVHNLEGSTTTNDANWAFGYNAAGQVASRTLVQVYERAVPALNESYSRNGLNQYTSVGGAAYNHDARGNLTSDGSRNFTYDYENRLLSATGSVSGTLAYDPLGRLRSYATGGTTTEFLYDGDRLVAEYVGNVVARRYAHGPGVDEPLIWYEGSGLATGQNWLIADRLGSIIATTNASGTATTYGYDPYGVPREWAGPGGAMLSRFRYTGQAALPELQLYHYKARVYDPALGRFLQTDPIGYEDDLNLYAYVRNDSLNNIDSTGRCAAWLAPAGGAALAEPSPIGEVAWAIAAAGACIYRGYRQYRAFETARAITEALQSGDISQIDPQDIEDQARNQENRARGLREQAEEHKQKLEDYRRDPDAHDNQGHLRRAGTDEVRRQRIIEGREQNLQGQIRNFENQAERAEAEASRLRSLLEQNQ